MAGMITPAPSDSGARAREAPPATVLATAALSAAAVACWCWRQAKADNGAHSQQRQQQRPPKSIQPAEVAAAPAVESPATVSVAVRNRHRQPQQFYDGGKFLDTEGRELCLGHIGVHKRKCRWGPECIYSHGTPCASSVERLAVALAKRQRGKKSLSAEQERKIAAAKAAALLPLPEWLHACRQELVFQAGIAAHGANPNVPQQQLGALERMQVAVCEFLEVFAAASEGAPAAGLTAATATAAQRAEALAMLHTQPLDAESVPMCPTLICAHKHGGRKVPTSWKRALMHQPRVISRLHRSCAYQAFLSAYHDFVREVVAPLSGEGEGAGGLVYQCPPTLRIAMPSRAPTIGMHVDSEYARHESSEINFWVPLSTPVEGENALHLESWPGKGDFRAVALGLGEGLRFNGQQCRHYTVPNSTGHTRVSLDFRVIPRSLFRDDWDGHIGDYATATC